eukprot:NODE_722_length_4463_cov_0.626489.p2 type:complete len:287 gc:universal NODE_722_length_4463_cov_0.626489:3279-2419(-)
MNVVQTKSERILILPDCCPNAKFLYYRSGTIEMPLNCLTPCKTVNYQFSGLARKKEGYILHPMYSHPEFEHEIYYGPSKDTFCCYLQLLKNIKIEESKDICEILKFDHVFHRQKFLNKRYMLIDTLEKKNIFNIVVLHNEYFEIASIVKKLLKQMGISVFLFYMTDVTLAKLGNLKGDFVIVGCFNKTLHLLYSEIARFAKLYTCWDILYWLNKDSITNFCETYYLNPMDIPKHLFDVVIESQPGSGEIIKATSTYGSFSGLPVEDKPVSKIVKGKTGIASNYNEI